MSGGVKLIFLDIDGILITSASWGRRDQSGHASAHPPCVVALNRIIRETGARIVVSSSWRIGQRIIKLREIINGHFGVVGDVIDKTPRIESVARFEGKPGKIIVPAVRGDEIVAWLESYERYPVDSFVILDDDSDMGRIADRLVHTEFGNGLTEADADRAIQMLTWKCEVSA